MAAWHFYEILCVMEKIMRIQLSDHFTYQRLLRFVFPSIIMMIFTSVYGVVDGIFVSNFAGKTSFAAVNLIMPFPMLLGAVGFMLGTGGSAIVAKTLGEGQKEKANQYFSMMVISAMISGVLLSVLGFILIRPIAGWLGAVGEMLDYCVMYGRILLAALTCSMLQNVFQSFMVTAEKPGLGLKITVAAGITNMVLDFLFIGVFRWGIAGAGIATGISQAVGGLIPLIYFLRKNDSLLQLVPTRPDGAILKQACLNGSSELMTNVSLSLVNILYNYQLIRLAGEDGVAAYGVIMYVNFIFVAVFIGYSIGSAPIVGYHYGAGNREELKNLYQKSIKLILFSGLLMTVLAVGMSGMLAKIFVGYDAALFALTKRGFCIYSLSFLFMGINIFASAFFTALGNGLVSALISFLRTLLFQMAAVLILPVLFDIDGIWMAIVAAEILALFITMYFFITKKKNYHY